MKLFTNIIESLDLDKSLDVELIESADRYPESGTAKTAKFQKEKLDKSAGDPQVEEIKNPDKAECDCDGKEPEEIPSIGKKINEGAFSELDIEIREKIENDLKEGLLSYESVANEFIKQCTADVIAKVYESLTGENLLGEDDKLVPVEDPEVPVEDPEGEVPEEQTDVCVGCVEPESIEINLDKDGTGVNEVELEFTEKPSDEDVKAAIEKFCGEEFFTVLDPVSEETDDGKFVYKFEFKEFNRDEDLEKQSDDLDSEEAEDNKTEEGE